MALSTRRLASMAPLVHALENRQFRRYTIGSAVSLCGTWIQRVALGWLAWELTKSGTWLGLVVFADLFPTILVSPLAGAVADRWDRLRVTRVAQIVALLQAAVLAGLVATGLANIWWLLVLALWSGTVAAFDQPARAALVPSIVGRDRIGGAVAVHSTIFALARFVGPAIAGILLVTSGPTGAFTANALSHLVFLLALAGIRPESVGMAKPKHGLARSTGEGIMYALQTPGIAYMLLMLAALGVGGRPIIELLPGFVDHVFNGDAMTLSICTASVGLGAILGSVFTGKSSSAEMVRMLMISGLIIIVGSAIFTSSGNIYAAIPSLAMLGFGMSASSIAMQTILQFISAEEYRGRVLSVFGLVFRGAPALTALGMGILSEWFGLQFAVIFGTFALISVWIWFGLRYGNVLSAVAFEHKSTSE